MHHLILFLFFYADVTDIRVSTDRTRKETISGETNETVDCAFYSFRDDALNDEKSFDKCIVMMGRASMILIQFRFTTKRLVLRIALKIPVTVQT